LIVTARIRCYLEAAVSAGADPTHYRPLTIFEVRMAMRDRCPSDNTLLEDVEFTNTEIAYCMSRPIDYWNEALPPIRNTYTAATFPYRYNWTDGAIGELLRMAGLNLTRNRLPLNAGGLSVDDKMRAENYINMGAQMIENYKTWVASKKYSINMEDTYGTSRIRGW